MTIARLFFLLVFCLVQTSTLPLLAQADQSAKPKLVLLIVADQFSYNYLSRYGDKMSSSGLRYLLENGAQFTNCLNRSASTNAASGYSIISTGAYPWTTGIVSSKWYDRAKKDYRSATQDSSNRMVGANGVAGGTKALNGTTLGDQMKLSSNGRSKVIGLCGDEQAALLLAGPLATSSLWFDKRSGNMVTSSHYGSSIPAWISAFNDQHFAERYIGKPWQRLMPETEYGASTRDDYPREAIMPNDGRKFPHIIAGGSKEGDGYYDNFAMTPFANQMICDLAKDALDKEQLGNHSDADLLVLGLSAGERLTQLFGPYSQECQDLVLRMDQSLSSLFQAVDDRVGLKNTLIIFTASHGSPAIPEFLDERGMEAGRLDPKVVANQIKSKLDQRLGEDNWVESFDPPNLYLNLDAIDKAKLRQPDVEQIAARAARSIQGIGEIFTAWQLYSNQLPSTPVSDKIRRSYYFGRSGELFVLTKPGHVFCNDTTGTGFGSHYSYDSQVPLLICGPGVRGGKYASHASLADISPTVASILAIEMPSSCEGNPLEQAITQVYGPPRPRISQGQ